MPLRVGNLVAPLALLVPLTAAAQPGEAPSCASMAICRQMALDAAERQEYETFHTLAWRAVQLGPRNDVALLTLLARAQSLSGRPDDALVMIGRLADMGAAVEGIESSEDFRRVRGLPRWPSVLERIRAIGTKPPAPSGSAGRESILRASLITSRRPWPRFRAPVPAFAPPTGRSAAAPVAAAESAAPPPTPPSSAETNVKTVPATAPGGPRTGLPIPRLVGAPVALAYDAVSERFVLADDASGVLRVVDELAHNAVDLVSQNWAKGARPTALAIDRSRGDLWVATVAESQTETAERSTVHRLQLVSGRLLYAVPQPPTLGAARFIDVRPTPQGVLVLDGAGRRILELPSGSKTMRVVMRVQFLVAPTSLAPADEGVAFVAHATGILRLQLSARTSSPVTAASGVNLLGLQWIGHVAGSLVGIQEQPDGGLAAVRIMLDDRRTRATALEVFDTASAKAASVDGDGRFHFLTRTDEGAVIVRRVTIK